MYIHIHLNYDTIGIIFYRNMGKIRIGLFVLHRNYPFPQKCDITVSAIVRFRQFKKRFDSRFHQSTYYDNIIVIYIVYCISHIIGVPILPAYYFQGIFKFELEIIVHGLYGNVRYSET